MEFKDTPQIYSIHHWAQVSAAVNHELDNNASQFQMVFVFKVQVSWLLLIHLRQMRLSWACKKEKETSHMDSMCVPHL